VGIGIRGGEVMRPYCQNSMVFIKSFIAYILSGPAFLAGHGFNDIKRLYTWWTMPERLQIWFSHHSTGYFWAERNKEKGKGL